jgi:N-glycosylase/DNA lyase
MKNKYSYRLVIQGNFGDYWEDMCDYDKKTEKKDAYNDIKEYRLSGQGSYRLISRRVLN